MRGIDDAAYQESTWGGDEVWWWKDHKFL